MPLKSSENYYLRFIYIESQLQWTDMGELHRNECCKGWAGVAPFKNDEMLLRTKTEN